MFYQHSMTLLCTALHSSAEHHVSSNVTWITYKITRCALLLSHRACSCKMILDHMLMHRILASQVSTPALNNILALKLEYELIAVEGQIG